MGGKSHLRRLRKVLVGKEVIPNLKDGILTGGNGRENYNTKTSFPKCLVNPKTLQWFGAGIIRFCLLSYESRWVEFIRNDLFLYILENILPEWVRQICWSQTWPALLPPVFFLFLGEIRDARLEGSQSGTFKITSTEKERRTKIKNSPAHQQDSKGARMFPFNMNKNLQTMAFREALRMLRKFLKHILAPPGAHTTHPWKHTPLLMPFFKTNVSALSKEEIQGNSTGLASIRASRKDNRLGASRNPRVKFKCSTDMRSLA